MNVTDEVLEAAAVAMEREMFAPHELPLPDELHARYLRTARAGLEAALAQQPARVGEDQLARIPCTLNQGGSAETVEAGAVLMFGGADPRCEALVDAVLATLYERGRGMPVPLVLGALRIVEHALVTEQVR